ncbi:tetratricopeptide repeat protein [Streptomyces griseosporeus]|uniref:tetratricopeptide repeat protein n=1 Tax=Streptomyces griseosporeus TaxID=1910 RepID=UPI0036FDFFEA
MADGAGGEAGCRAVEDLAQAVGRDTGVSVRELAEAAEDPVRRDAVRVWGDRLAGLLSADPGVARAVAGAMEAYAPGSTAAWYGGDHTDFRGGLFLREVVGVQIVIQQGSADPPEALAGHPARPSGFTGRTEELETVLAALDPAAASGATAVLVAAVSGLGGIGKTALAVETAHMALDRGWFPGGVLFVDLHGYDAEPVTAGQALQTLLSALGVESEHIPATMDERAALYRSTLAARGRECGAILVLADNASSPRQVRPLLPGDARHRVLVTSRDRLPQLGARLVPLGELSPREAYELLDRALRIADPDDTRIADDPDAAQQLATLCGHLPLALRIAAALLAEDACKPVNELVRELAESHDRLDDLDDGEDSVRATFELSYRRLPPEQARLLRLLALAPGPDVGEDTVAALAGAEKPPVRELKALVRAHLVERIGRERWRLHDLVRQFGAGVVAGDAELREEGDAARERVLASWLPVADAADDWMRHLPGMEQPERFADRGQALAWLDRERAGLVAVMAWESEQRFTSNVVLLAGCLSLYLDWRRQFDDLITVARSAQRAAHRAGNVRAEALAYNNWGLALREAGRPHGAINVLVRARTMLQALGDRFHEGHAWNNLGLALLDVGRVQDAIDAHTRARELYQAAGDRRLEARALNNLGQAMLDAGEVRSAIDAHTAARRVLRSLRDERGAGMALFNIGNALWQADRQQEAIRAYKESREIARGLEDWYGTGAISYALASAYESIHRLAEARTEYLLAADAFTRADLHAEAATVRAQADAVIGDSSPTDKPTQASPPAHKPASAQPSPPPPGAPGTAGQ